MTLPASRNTTYGAASPVKSNDLNALQDCVISNKHATLTMLVSAAEFLTVGAAATYSATLGIAALPLNAIAPLTLPAGCRITAIRFFVKDNSSGPTKLQGALVSSDHAGGTSVIASSAISAGTGASQTLTVTPGGGGTTLATGTTYYLNMATTTGAATGNCYGAEVDYDRP